MKKKFHILLLVFVAMFVLVGWGKKEVKLLDSSLLIDLNKAIETAKPGGNSGDTEDAPEEVPEEESETSLDSVNNTEADENSEINSNMGDVSKIIKIRVRGEKIFYSCGNIIRDGITAPNLENRIRMDFVSGTQVLLMDDFAETHAYKNVRTILKRLKNDIGLKYNEEPYAGGE